MARSEYIEDRVLRSSEVDRLHHSQLADEISHLIVGESTPLHIALYGPWGSGKSSLGLRLQAKLKTKDKSTRFVVFNAWKFAREPLQRQFISQIAKELGVNKIEYARGLYQRKRHTELHIPVHEIGRLASVFAGLLLAIAVFVGLVAAFVSAEANRGFTATFADLVTKAMAPALLSAGFIAGILALMGKLFSIDIEDFEPASEERFEELFRGLVDDVVINGPASKIVFFIDELDRCSPREVVDVLETMRTFLDVRGCVFVVAADQQVLERALTKAVRHDAPEDTERPYYSSGAEYLDKIFQYQMHIPPLFPQRLTEFALELVLGRPGVWAIGADQLEVLVSILIPSHVSSPRRVKILLNAFVAAYRVAAARYGSDKANSPNPAERLLELAKLSTLRLEFPLFYRDLERHPRLASDLTTLLTQGWTQSLTEITSTYGTQRLVYAYANKERPTDYILSKEARSQGAESEDGDSDGRGE